MTFRTYLIRARSHIVFLLGLFCAFGLVIALENWQPTSPANQTLKIERTRDSNLPSPRPLTAEEMEWAKIAWRYFERNTQAATGLVNSVDTYPSNTLWDTSSYLLGLIAAHRLGLVDKANFDQRITRALDSLAKLKLFDGKLPNKVYNTTNLEMTDYGNQPTPKGIGWSAIDIGRLLSPLNILIWNYPQHTARVKSVILAWDFGPLVKDGIMYGATYDKNGKIVYPQEGRLGYEQYAAKSLALLGLDVNNALSYGPYLKYVDIYDVKVPTDSRTPEKYHAHNYVVSESYILDGLEYGWDHVSTEFAYRVYRAQRERFARTGQLTAVSEDNIDQAPYFVYNTVFSSGKAWNTITESGKDASEFRSISTKAVFGWHALYQTEYTQQLLDAVKSLYDPEKGWYSGLYEVSKKPNTAITANTNGIILQALSYKQFGPMVRPYPVEKTQ
jgi:WD40 repeat protein